MKILIKQATIIDPNSEHNGKVKDLLIENNTIVSIQDIIKDEDANGVIDLQNTYLPKL